jgi:rhodanese-related sulfurtransferase
MTRLRIIALFLLAVVLSVLVSCRAGGEDIGQQTEPAALETQVVPVEGGGSYIDVNAAGLAGMLRSKDFLLINVHIPYDGEIDGTDLFLPYNEIESNLDKLPEDKGAQLVVYCRSGGMSAIAARTLVKLGYTDVWNLDGGMIAWTEAGYPLVDQG